MQPKIEFQHALGSKAQSKVTRLKGTIISRAEHLYGCNRYYVQPEVGSDGKVPDGWWMDEADVEIIEEKVAPPRRDTGGPMSKIL